jgi:phage tail-like protein
MSTANLRKDQCDFPFIVEIGGAAQAAFTECSVPVIEWEIEEMKEGGLNTFTHQLPGHRKGASLTLKNGVGSTALYDWCVQTMSESFERKKVTVTLLDSLKEKVMSWDPGWGLSYQMDRTAAECQR